jgi:hypothetical protein
MQSLQISIRPNPPAVGEEYGVTVESRALPIDQPIHASVTGSDGYSWNKDLVADQFGRVTFAIPGAPHGVKDEIFVRAGTENVSAIIEFDSSGTRVRRERPSRDVEAAVLEHSARRCCLCYCLKPRWSPQIRPMVVTPKPANENAIRTSHILSLEQSFRQGVV